MRRGDAYIVVVWVLTVLGMLVVFGYWNKPIIEATRSAGSYTQSVAVFFIQSITPEQLRLAYTGGTQPSGTMPSAPNKIRILIVPGHEPDVGGTGFADYTERDIVVEIADKLAALLEKNAHYDVLVARTKDAWDPALAQYFVDKADDIRIFRDRQTSLMNQYLLDGRLLEEGSEQVQHNDAPLTTALHLYGINKWASEHNVSITLHLHINDYPGRMSGAVGPYGGFAIYVPNNQYSNAAASLEIGNALAVRLNRFHATSTLPQEARGVLEDQQLIAIGSNNSNDAASVLIEYGYIYEPQFQNAETRDVAEKDYAYETYLGIQDFFKDPAPTLFGTDVLPYARSTHISPGATQPDTYALQAGLRYLGMYPPMGRTFSDCPLSGYYGDCTTSSISAFQLEQGLPVTGVVDQITRQALKAYNLGS